MNCEPETADLEGQVLCENIFLSHSHLNVHIVDEGIITCQEQRLTLNFVNRV